MGEAETGLAEIERQRAALAKRLRLPGWYLVLYGVGAAALLAAQPVALAFDAGIAGFGMQVFGGLVLCTPGLLLPRITGMRLPVKASAAYPSMLRTIWVLVGGLMLGLLGTMALTFNEFFVPAIGVALAGGGAAGLAIRHVYLGIGRDIAEGAVRR